MTTDRFDSLLARALATGTIPPEATAAERAELEPLLRTGAILEQAGAETAREASTSMPIARARFERFVVAESQKAGLGGVAARPTRRGIFGRLAHSHRGLLLVGGAVAVGLVAVIAVFGTQSLFSGTETADAQVLVPDDFVQVQGVAGSVSLVDGVRTVTLQSEFGNVSVLLSADTSVVRDQTNATSDSIKPGDSLLVGGVVGAGDAVDAQTVAVTAAQSSPPKQSKALQLKKLLPGLRGRIVLLAIANDAKSAHVLIEAANGKRYNVNVDAATAGRLLTSSANALGASVSVNDGASPGDDVFGLTVDGSDGAGTSLSNGCPLVSEARPGFAGVCGVIVARKGNVLSVMDSSRTLHEVSIRPATRILLGESGLTAKSIRQGDTVIGHTIVVTGGLDASGSRIVADLVVVGKKFDRAQ
jgi:hypothetical protein